MNWEQIPGWFDWSVVYQEVVDKYDGGFLVEVGTYLGRSLCCLGEMVKQSGKPFHVIGVDWCVGSGVENGHNSHEEAVQEGLGSFAGTLHRNIIACGLQDVVTLIVADSKRAANLFRSDSLTMVCLDGRHDYESVKSDILKWLPRVRPGGVLMGDDMGVPDEVPVWPGVRKAVEELLPGHQYKPHDAWYYEKG